MSPTFPNLARSNQVSRSFGLKIGAAMLVFKWCNPVGLGVSRAGVGRQSDRHQVSGHLPPPSPARWLPTSDRTVPGLNSSLVSSLWSLGHGCRLGAQDLKSRCWPLWCPGVASHAEAVGSPGAMGAAPRRCDQPWLPGRWHLGSLDRWWTSLPWSNCQAQFHSFDCMNF